MSDNNSTSSEEDSVLSNEEIKRRRNNVKKIEETKEVKFKRERNAILKKINKILGVTEKKKKFNLNDITEEQKKKIIYLTNYIGAFFCSKSIAAFSKKNTVKRAYLSLIKLVYREMNYTIQRISKYEKGVMVSYYIIFKE